MPELPEVETVRLQLLHKVVGKTISKIQVHNQKSTGNDEAFSNTLLGKTIEHVDRVGKLMIFSFVEQDDLFMLGHLKMTGQFFYIDTNGEIGGSGHSMSENDIKNLPNNHTRISLYFTDDTSLHFNDMRKFGYLKLASANEVTLARARFGPEPIHEAFDVEEFTRKLKKRKTPIKAALLDQTFIAGLGNIYVDEALFAAGVRPDRRADLVSNKEAAAIAAASGAIMNASIKVGGTTFQHFADTDGKIGNYTNYLQVFGKQNTPCPRCGTTIEKTRVAGRGAHFCPQCQK